MPNDGDLIGSVEAAKLLDRSPRTIHRLVETGQLTPALTAPGGYAGTFLFYRGDVESLARERIAESA